MLLRLKFIVLHSDELAISLLYYICIYFIINKRYILRTIFNVKKKYYLINKNIRLIKLKENFPEVSIFLNQQLVTSLK